MKKISLIIGLIFFINPFLFAQNKIGLSFNGNINLSAEGNAVHIEKFSDYLKVTASGQTQVNGQNVNFSLSLSCPKFNFINGKTNHYQNEKNYFLDARADALLSVTIDTVTYTNDFRSKDSANVLPQVATTNYSIDAQNNGDSAKNYLIELNINSGSVLKESSNTLSANQVKSIVVANGNFILKNPQPFLPKVKDSFIEVTGKTKMGGGLQ